MVLTDLGDIRGTVTSKATSPSLSHALSNDRGNTLGKLFTFTTSFKIVMVGPVPFGSADGHVQSFAYLHIFPARRFMVFIQLS